MIQLIYEVADGSIDITEFTESLNWKGSIKQSVRALEISLFMNEGTVIPLEIGGTLSFFYEQKQLFKGKLFSIKEMKETSKYKLVFYDLAVLLNKSKITLKTRNLRGEDVIREMCKKLDLKFGHITKTSNISSFVASNKTGREIIDSVYKNSKEKNKNTILPMFYNDQLNILSVGEEHLPIQIVEGVNVLSAQYHKTAETLINSVKVCNQNGTELAVIEDADSIKEIGRFQHVLVTSSKDFKTEAKEWLSKSIESLEVVVLGNQYFLSGYKVTVKDASENYQQDYIVVSDSHTFDQSGYKTYLTLKSEEVVTNG